MLPSFCSRLGPVFARASSVGVRLASRGGSARLRLFAATAGSAAMCSAALSRPALAEEVFTGKLDVDDDYSYAYNNVWLGPKSPSTSDRILMVFVDGSPAADRALEQALQSKKPNDRLFVVHGYENERYVAAPTWALGPPAGLLMKPDGEDAGLKQLNAYRLRHARKTAERYGQKLNESKVLNAAVVVLASVNAKEAACHFINDIKPEVVFVGSRGLGALQSVIVGSFSQHLLHHINCSILIAH